MNFNRRMPGWALGTLVLAGVLAVAALFSARAFAASGVVLADFEGGALPEGFTAGAAKGSGTVARDRVRAVDLAT